MDNRNVTASFKRGAIVGLIRKNQTLKPGVIIEFIHGKYGMYKSNMKAWKAKQKAIAQIFGDWEESYSDLPRLMIALLNTNLGTVVEWCTRNTHDPLVRMFGRVL